MWRSVWTRTSSSSVASLADRAKVRRSYGSPLDALLTARRRSGRSGWVSGARCSRKRASSMTARSGGLVAMGDKSRAPRARMVRCPGSFRSPSLRSGGIPEGPCAGRSSSSTRPSSPWSPSSATCSWLRPCAACSPIRTSVGVRSSKRYVLRMLNWRSTHCASNAGSRPTPPGDSVKSVFSLGTAAAQRSCRHR